MGLEDRLTDAVALAFENLGGDPVEAVTTARTHDSLDAWIRAQTLQTGLAGGLEVSLPGLQGATLAAGTLYLLRKMARLSWGIGAFQDAYVLELGGLSDIRNILILWADQDSDTPAPPDHRAIGLDLLLHVLDTPGRLALYDLIDRTEPDTLTAYTLAVLADVCEVFDGSLAAREMVAALRDEAQASTAHRAAQRFITTQTSHETGIEASRRNDRKPARPSSAAQGAVARTMGRKVSTRVARDVAMQLAARMPIRYLSGFIPIAGAVINATYNAQTLASMGRAARAYYEDRLTLGEFYALTGGDPRQLGAGE